MADILHEFKERHQSFPNIFLEIEFNENRQDYPHLEDVDETHVNFVDDDAKNEDNDRLRTKAATRWDAILEEMATNFDTVLEIEQEDYDDYDEHYARMQSQLDKSFDLLKQWFFNLWD